MAKYICLEKELEISKYRQLKTNHGFEIVYDSGLSELGNPYPLDMNLTETYDCFQKICKSLRKTTLNRQHNNMSFCYVYDLGHIDDVYLALALTGETEINLRLDISFEDLLTLSEDIDRLADKYVAAIRITGAIEELNDLVGAYSDIFNNEIDLSELQIIHDIRPDLREIMRRCADEMYIIITEYEHTPTA
jgi:hypothetical protein